MSIEFNKLIESYEGFRAKGASWLDFEALMLDYYRQELGPLFDKYYTQVYLGVNIGPGWIPAYVELARNMEEVAQKYDYHFSVAQVKQKFGELRVYIQPLEENATADAALSVFLKAAVRRCAQTCESCGRKGELGGRAWLSVACEKHLVQ